MAPYPWNSYDEFLEEESEWMKKFKNVACNPRVPKRVPKAKASSQFSWYTPFGTLSAPTRPFLVRASAPRHSRVHSWYTYKIFMCPKGRKPPPPRGLHPTRDALPSPPTQQAAHLAFAHAPPAHFALALAHAPPAHLALSLAHAPPAHLALAVPRRDRGPRMPRPRGPRMPETVV